MRLIWVVIPLVLFGIIGMQDVESQVPASYYYSELTIDRPPKLGETSVLTLEVSAVNENTNDFPDYGTKIILPEGFELVSGDLIQTNLWEAGEPLIVQVTIKAVQIGNWTIHGLALSATGDALYITVSEDNAYLTEYEISSYLSPRTQVDIGVASSDIICKEGLELIFKSSDNSPACVKPATAEKLIQRGWAIQQSIDSSNISESDVSYTLKAPVSLERHPIENTDFGTKFGTPVVIDLNFQTQFVTNELENQLFYVANVIPDDVILKYIFKQDFGNDGRTNYSIIYLPPDQDVAADESYGFVYGRGGIIVSVDYLHLTAEQTDIFVDGLLEQRSGSTSKLIDNKRIFYQNGTIGSTQSELVVYDPVLNLVTRVTSYDYDANILEQIALSMVFV